MPRWLWLSFSTIALLALGACADRPPAPPVVMPYAVAPEAPPASEAPKPSASLDSLFIDQAAVAVLTMVDLGHLARAKATRKYVRHFAGHIIGDYTLMDRRLTALLRRLNMAPSTSPQPDQEAHDKLAAADGRAFDKQYVFGQAAGHISMIRLFEGEAHGGRDVELRHFARDMLPTLRQNLRKAQALARKVG